MRPLRVGSRKSELALIQSRSIITALGGEAELVLIQTQGDRVTDRPLNQVGSAGLFIKEIESALLEERIDLAVHSMKDMPSEIPEGLALAATTKRLDARDALVSRGADSLASLPEGAKMATGSLRRRSQLLAARPDLHIEDLRGNVQTRLKKFDASSWEAIVLAGAGLVRMGLDARITSYFSVDEMIPAVGQGALALETRYDDDLRNRLREINHPASESAILAERTFLRRLQGGCQVPIGAYGEIEAGELRLRGFVGGVDGRRYEKNERRGPVAAAQELGLALAEDMLAGGASEIIQEQAEVDE